MKAIANVDWGDNDRNIVTVFKDGEILKVFEGKYAVLQAANWARMKDLRMDLRIEKERKEF